MKITVTAPCYNEIRFVRAWLQNCLDWGADQVIVNDGGSTDGTLLELEVAQKYYGDWLVIQNGFQVPNAQAINNFNEGGRRQDLNNQVKEGIQVLLDVDEMLPDDSRRIIETLKPGEGGSFQLVQFWRSPNYIRVNTEADPTWGPCWKLGCFWAGTARWQMTPHHCHLQSSFSIRNLEGMTKFHYHYLYGTPKDFENRRTELVGNLPDWEIRLRSVKVQHPKAFALLEEHGKFAEMTS
jgi:glycosyltransferase involved in cell wall biosynthesis